MKPLVGISYYDRRPLEPLVGLLDSLDAHEAGTSYQRILCVNATGQPPLPEAISSRFDAVFIRQNHGMNIGAWDAVWRNYPGRPCYLFLQDECYAVRDGWLSGVTAALGHRKTGLVGESLNGGWAKPWEELRSGPGKDVLPEHFVGDRVANRVDVYLHHMKRWKIDPGPTGRHLRSLVWGIRGETLESIGGFAHGGNYGECIAAEIGASRAVEALGLGLVLTGPSPFHLFRHREWNQDEPGGNFTHKPSMLLSLDRARREVAALRARIENPTWSDLCKGVATRLGIRRSRSS